MWVFPNLYCSVFEALTCGFESDESPITPNSIQAKKSVYISRPILVFIINDLNYILPESKHNVLIKTQSKSLAHVTG